jgi:hypothetical protein
VDSNKGNKKEFRHVTESECERDIEGPRGAQGVISFGIVASDVQTVTQRARSVTTAFSFNKCYLRSAPDGPSGRVYRTGRRAAQGKAHKPILASAAPRNRQACRARAPQPIPLFTS